MSVAEKIEYAAFSADSHLAGVVGLLREIRWDNFSYDPDLTLKSLTAPGVTTVVAVAGEPGPVVGFAQVFGDGVVQAHLGLLAVDREWRRMGVGRGLVEEAFGRSGTERMDLTASDEALDFYRSFRHREQAGFRIYRDRHED